MTATAEKLKELIAEAEKQYRLKTERPRCGTPVRLTEMWKVNPLDQYLEKKNSE